MVQNILHGLSPSLCEAIQSVPRWKVIQAAFPHVMHACSALIQQCKQNDQGNTFNHFQTLPSTHCKCLEYISADLFSMILTQQFAVKMHGLVSAFLQPASANIH